MKYLLIFVFAFFLINNNVFCGPNQNELNLKLQKALNDNIRNVYRMNLKEFENSYKEMESLLKAGADPHAIIKYHCHDIDISAIALAVETDFLLLKINHVHEFLLTKLFLKYKANINFYEKNITPPLMYLINRSNYGQADEDEKFEMGKFLIDKGADVNLIINNENALTLALRNSADVRLIKYILKKIVSVKLFERSSSLLTSATLNRSSNKINELYEILDLLIDKGADVNFVDENEISTLQSVVINSHLSDSNLLKIIDLLIDKGANVNFVDKSTEGSVFMYASIARSIEILDFLLKKGANPHFEDSRGENALFTAVMYNKKSVIEYLVNEVKMDVNKTDNFGRNVLAQVYFNKNYMEVIEFLLWVYEPKSEKSIELI